MSITRRDAIRISGTTLAGLSLTKLSPEELASQTPPAQQEPWPETLVERPLRQGFPAPLPLNPDGSAPEHPVSAVGTISQPYMWRYTNRQPPPLDYDYRNLKIRVDTRGLARMAGTLRFQDLERLPRVSHIFLLQCGAPNPTGIVKWTGVRFNDFLNLIQPVPGAHYARIIASDRYYIDEPLSTLRHPQVLLAWMLNDQPLAPEHGAPIRLVVPFRYGARSIKAITEIGLYTPTPPTTQLPT